MICFFKQVFEIWAKKTLEWANILTLSGFKSTDFLKLLIFINVKKRCDYIRRWLGKGERHLLWQSQYPVSTGWQLYTCKFTSMITLWSHLMMLQHFLNSVFLYCCCHDDPWHSSCFQLEISIFEDRGSGSSSPSSSMSSAGSARWLEGQRQAYGYHHRGSGTLTNIRMLKHESTRF